MKSSPDYVAKAFYALVVGVILWRVGAAAYESYVEWHHDHYIGVDENHPIIKDKFWPNEGQPFSPLLKDRKIESLLGPTGDNTMKGLLGPLPDKNDPKRNSMIEDLIGKK